MLEKDPRWPGVVFNATCLIGPAGILYKYRKVNPWIPYEVHASPHDLPGYDEPLFPVADTEIGRLGCAICYDWLFPEAIRQLTANGAEVLDPRLRVHGPVGRDGADGLVDDREPRAARSRTPRTWSPPTRARACATTRRTRGRAAAWSWTSTAASSAQASPGPGERIVTAPVDISAVRHERQTRVGHHMLAHLRTEAYPVYGGSGYPPAMGPDGLGYEANVARIRGAKDALAGELVRERS